MSHRRGTGSDCPVDRIFNNSDFIQKILLHIPAKPLTKFKCVCQSWKTIISNPKFRQEHSLLNPSPCHLGLYLYNKFRLPVEIKSIPIKGLTNLPPLDFLGNFHIVNACNGLALCFNETEKDYAVCNPTTKDVHILPKVTDIYITVWKVFECLVFDPSKSPNYKVIFMYITKYAADKIMIFSSEENSWKDVPLRVLPGVPATRVIYLKGALHWLTANNVHYEFGVDSEELNCAAMAQNPNIRANNVRYFGECDGTLYLALGGSSTNMCTIWEMEWDTKLWISKYKINFRDIISQRVDEGPKFYVLDIVKGSTPSGLTLVIATPGGFVSYDPGRRVLEVLSDFLPSEFSEIPNTLTDVGSYTYRFIESLFCV